MDSCSLQAMYGRHHEIFPYASTTGTLQLEQGSHVGTGWICQHLCTRRVSLRFDKVSLLVSLWDWRELGKNEQVQALHANMNELIVFQDIARYRFW